MWREEREQRGDRKKKMRGFLETGLLSDGNKSSRVTRCPPVGGVAHANSAISISNKMRKMTQNLQLL